MPLGVLGCESCPAKSRDGHLALERRADCVLYVFGHERAKWLGVVQLCTCACCSAARRHAEYWTPNIPPQLACSAAASLPINFGRLCRLAAATAASLATHWPC